MQNNNKRRNKNPNMSSSKNDKEPDSSRSSFVHLLATSRDITPYLGLGLQLAASILVFLFLGRWVDGKLGTYPVFMIIGAFIGAAGGMISFIRTVLRHEESKKRKKTEHED
jgi:ATP synthase protein I